MKMMARLFHIRVSFVHRMVKRERTAGNKLKLGIGILVDLAVRVRGRHFLFNSVIAVAVCLWGRWAGWTELNRKQSPQTHTARSPSV